MKKKNVSCLIVVLILIVPCIGAVAIVVSKISTRRKVPGPNGEFAAFCGMFYKPTRRFGHIEQVATYPRYRRLGLGKAAVLKGIHRCDALSASVAYVGNDLPIYQADGFRKIYNSECWLKYYGEDYEILL